MSLFYWVLVVLFWVSLLIMAFTVSIEIEKNYVKCETESFNTPTLQKSKKALSFLMWVLLIILSLIPILNLVLALLFLCQSFVDEFREELIDRYADLNNYEFAPTKRNFSTLE